MFNSRHATWSILPLFAPAQHRTASQVRRAWLYVCIALGCSCSKPHQSTPWVHQLSSLFHSPSKALVSFETHTHTVTQTRTETDTHTKMETISFLLFLWREHVYPKLVVRHSPGVRCYLFIMYNVCLFPLTIPYWWTIPFDLYPWTPVVCRLHINILCFVDPWPPTSP